MSIDPPRYVIDRKFSEHGVLLTIIDYYLQGVNLAGVIDAFMSMGVIVEEKYRDR